MSVTSCYRFPVEHLLITFLNASTLFSVTHKLNPCMKLCLILVFKLAMDQAVRRRLLTSKTHILSRSVHVRLMLHKVTLAGSFLSVFNNNQPDSLSSS